MSRGKNETRKRVLYAHGVVFFTKALKGPSSSSSSSFFFAVKRETFYSLLIVGKRRMRWWDFVCALVHIHNETRPFSTKTLRWCWRSFFLFSFFFGGDFFQTCSVQIKEEKPLISRTKPLEFHIYT